MSSNRLVAFEELSEFKQELIKRLGISGGRTGSISCQRDVTLLQTRFSKSVRNNCDVLINGSWMDCFRAGYEAKFTGTVLYFARTGDVCLFHKPKSKNKMLEELRNFQAELRRIDELFETWKVITA
jgi:hypothetical protein